jgi:hypothetical protein
VGRVREQWLTCGPAMVHMDRVVAGRVNMSDPQGKKGFLIFYSFSNELRSGNKI